MHCVVVGRYHQAWVESLNWRKVKLSDGHHDDSSSTDEGITICYCLKITREETKLVPFRLVFYRARRGWFWEQLPFYSDGILSNDAEADFG